MTTTQEEQPKKRYCKDIAEVLLCLVTWRFRGMSLLVTDTRKQIPAAFCIYTFVPSVQQTGENLCSEGLY